MNIKQEAFLTAMKSLNAGLNKDGTSTLVFVVPDLTKFGIAAEKLEETKRALDHVLPSGAYEKPHPGLDEVVGLCYGITNEAKALKQEVGMNKTK